MIVLDYLSNQKWNQYKMSTDNEMSGKKLDTICDQQLGGYWWMYR